MTTNWMRSFIIGSAEIWPASYDDTESEDERKKAMTRLNNDRHWNVLRLVRYVTVLLCVLTVLAARPVTAQTYSIEDLGTLLNRGNVTGDAYYATDVNNNGDVAGYLDDTLVGERIAIVWKNGVMNSLPRGPGNHHIAFAINNSGSIVGQTENVSQYDAACWFLNAQQIYQGVVLPTLGGATGTAWDINDSGQAVGEADNSQSLYRAVLWQNLMGLPIVTDLGSLGVHGDLSSYAMGINNSGQAVGGSLTSSGAEHAVLWQNLAGIPTITDLGTLGGINSSARRINDSGQAVGNSQTSSGNRHAFLFSGGIITDMGTLGFPSSDANDINSGGVAVGRVYDSAGNQHAFRYSGGIMSDLNNLVLNNAGWQLAEATGINFRGQIVGWGSHVINGQTYTRAFRLTPITNWKLLKLDLPPLVYTPSKYQVTIWLDAPAGKDGANVALFSSNSQAAPVPKNILIKPGEKSSTFLMNALQAKVKTVVTITAAYGGVTKENTVTLLP